VRSSSRGRFRRLFPLKDNIPTDRTPWITIALIAANVAVYFLLQDGLWGLPDEGRGGEWTVGEYAGIPCTLTGASPCEAPPEHQGAVLTVFTSMFMHGSLLHLGGNMLFLWIFGNNIEDSMGPVRYVVFYFLGGLAAFGLQTAVDPGSDIPTLGASGAVAAVLGGYLLLYPRARVITLIFVVFFFTIIELPALFVLGFWFVTQLLMGLYDLQTPTGEGGVAYFAHIGGFVLGMALIRLFATREKPIPPRYPVY
jgi:membrane associated rhomboid family serine protease